MKRISNLRFLSTVLEAEGERGQGESLVPPHTRGSVSLSLSIGGGGSMLTMRVPWGSMNAVEKMKLGIG